MSPVNAVLNKVHDWSDPSYNAFTRNVVTRITNVAVSTPLEALAVVQNLALTPVKAVGFGLNVGTKIVRVLTGSETLKKLESKLPSLTDFLRTVGRVIAYSIGTLFTATLGFLSPELNFKVHCGIGLAFNKAEEAVKKALAEAEAKTAAMAEQAKAEATRKLEEARSAELEALNNLADVYTIANDIGARTAEDALEDVQQLFKDVEETVGGAQYDARSTSEKVAQLEQDLVDALKGMEEKPSEFALSNVITTGKVMAEEAVRTAKKVVNLASFGYFFPRTQEA